MLRPRRCSESAIDPGTGHIIGAFHHASVSGVACAFHHRIQMLRTGSPASWGIRLFRLAATGHVQKIASAENPSSAHIHSCFASGFGVPGSTRPA